jgi:hypothetical protein
MNETDIRMTLDRLVPPFADEPEQWNDVVARAAALRAAPRLGRGSRRLIVAIAAAVALAIPSFGLGGRLVDLVSRDDPVLELPKQADSSRVTAVVEPATGELLVLVAPMRRADGICYVVLQTSSGCARRSRTGYLVNGGPRVSGFTFDRRAVSAEILAAGERTPISFHRLGAPIDAGFFFERPDTDARGAALLLRDRAGTVIRRIRLKLPTPPPAAK